MKAFTTQQSLTDSGLAIGPISGSSGSSTRDIHNPSGRKQVFIIDPSGEIAESAQGLDCQLCRVGSIDELLARVKRNTRGCVLVDCDSLLMPLAMVMNRLWREVLSFPVIAVSGQKSTSVMRDAFQFGAIDFLPKPISSNSLESAIDRAIVLDDMGELSTRTLRIRFGDLTARERQILQQCLRGFPSKAIASQLDITFQTVDKHRARALKKLGVGSVLQLVWEMVNSPRNSPLNFV